ncbi:hypothetical protein ABW21_db0201273 [Orbilia brochopaga]|nr:hypothetical protein ABW21_db0201273 [Drechslerella brochopaga]
MSSQKKAQAASPTKDGKTVDQDGFETVSRKLRAEPSARAQPPKKGRGKNGRTRRGGARHRQGGSSPNEGDKAQSVAAKTANEEGVKSIPQPAAYIAPRRVPGLSYAAVAGKAVQPPAPTIQPAVPKATPQATTVAVPAAGATVTNQAAAAKKGTSAITMVDAKVPGADLARTFNHLITDSQTMLAAADIDAVCQAWLHSQQESLAAQMQQQCDAAARAIAAGDILGIPAWALHENECLVLTTDKVPDILFRIADVVCGRHEEWLGGIGIRAYEVAYDELENYDTMKSEGGE